jgi:SAM-dependent methyltransferase
MNDRNAAKFDAYAAEYERLHAENVSLSGEETDYFARYKVECLARAGVTSRDRILDFGCGIGNTTVQLVERFSDVHGYEPSKLSAERTRQRARGVTVYDESSAVPEQAFSVAVLSCVLHHVPPAERRGVMQQVMNALEPGGRLFVFEHNPWNPLTRRAVATCPFDDDAILLWPGEQRRLLRESGFVDVSLDYIVFFPRALSFLRSLEPRLRWLAAGAQTMTQGVKPRAAR